MTTGKKFKIVFINVLVAAYCLFGIYYSASKLYLSLRLSIDGVETVGVIVSSQKVVRRNVSTRLQMIVEYRDENDETYELTHLKLFDYSFKEVVGSVPVKYIKNDPQEALVDNFWNRLVVPLFAVVIHIYILYIYCLEASSVYVWKRFQILRQRKSQNE